MQFHLVLTKILPGLRLLFAHFYCFKLLSFLCCVSDIFVFQLNRFQIAHQFCWSNIYFLLSVFFLLFFNVIYCPSMKIEYNSILSLSFIHISLKFFFNSPCSLLLASCIYSANVSIESNTIIYSKRFFF